MKTDLQIASENVKKPIGEIASSLNLQEDEFEILGSYKGKISPLAFERRKDQEDSPLVLVSAISPTPFGEGKTTISIGLADGLRRLGKKAILALREPSLGPVFGMKGGACGGGYSQVVPMEDINLHFTGDFHAITTANNLLAAMIDNHIHQGNDLQIDPRRITWKRCMDMNDRQLRFLVNGLGGPSNGVPREDQFQITAASEMMAILCLADNLDDLKKRIGSILIGYRYDRSPVFCRDLKAEGAMTVLLKEAIKPNLVQTLEHTPCLIHGGPFANIAHGCNSVVATKMARKLGEVTITEAGFGADLGLEKFMDIKMRSFAKKVSGVVLVATIRALKYHGEGNDKPLQEGLKNLYRHVENIQEKYGLPVLIAINQFPDDTFEEIKELKACLAEKKLPMALCQGFLKGGEGMLDLAQLTLDMLEKKAEAKLLYGDELSLKEKFEKVAKEIYRAKSVNFSKEALRNMKNIEKNGFGNLPVCIAKTQYSFSDKQRLRNAPEDFDFSIRDIYVQAGAGFVVGLSGTMMTMPGLGKRPQAELIDIDSDGNIVGLF